MRILPNLIGFSLVLSVGLSASAIVNGRSAGANEATETLDLTFSNVACTGVAIQKNIILTAGHCIEFLGNDRTIQITNGNEADRYSKKVTVLKAKYSPQFGGTRNGQLTADQIPNDIGYIEISENLNSLFPNLRFPVISGSMDASGLSAALSQGHLVTAGYGFSQVETEMGGVINIQPNYDKHVLNLTLNSIGAGGFFQSTSAEARKSECGGDSGSGIFVEQGQTRTLVGILSGIGAVSGSGTRAGQVRDWGRATTIAADVYVAPHLCWLQKETGIQLSSTPLNCN